MWNYEIYIVILIIYISIFIDRTYRICTIYEPRLYNVLFSMEDRELLYLYLLIRLYIYEAQSVTKLLFSSKLLTYF